MEGKSLGWAAGQIEGEGTKSTLLQDRDGVWKKQQKGAGQSDREPKNQRGNRTEKWGRKGKVKDREMGRGS